MQKMKKVKIIAQLLVLSAFLCFFFLFAFSQYIEINDLNDEIASLENEIKDEESISEKLQEEFKYSQSDDFVEKIARERLGLIKYDEMIFMIDR